MSKRCDACSTASRSTCPKSDSGPAVRRPRCGGPIYAVFDRFGLSGTLLLLGLGALVLGNVFRLTFPLAAPLLGIAAAGCLGAALFFAFRGNRQRPAKVWRGQQITDQAPGFMERLQRAWAHAPPLLTPQ